MGARERRKHPEGQAGSRTSAMLVTWSPQAMDLRPVAAVRVMKRLCRLVRFAEWPRVGLCGPSGGSTDSRMQMDL